MSRHLDGTGSGHPIARLLDVLEDALDEAADAATWSLSVEETTRLVSRLVTDQARLAEVESRLLAHAQTVDVHGAAGMRSLSSWLARTTRMTKGEANAKVRLAEALACHDQTRHAVGQGEVLPEQAMAITNAVDELSDEHAGDRDRAEAYLIEQAAHHHAHHLATLGQRILEVIDPDKADAHEAKLLEDQEARAQEEDPAQDAHRRRRARARVVHDPRRPGRDAAQGAAGTGRPQARRVPTRVPGPTTTTSRPRPRWGRRSASTSSATRPTSCPTMGGMAATIVITADADIFTTRRLQGRPHRDRPGHLTGPPAALGVRGQRDARGPQHATVRSSTSAASSASTPRPNASRSSSPRRPARPPAATSPARSATSTTPRPGPTAVRPTPVDAVLLCPFHHHQTHATGATYPLRT